MFSVISDQQTQQSTWNPRLIINRVGRSASSFVAVGVLIGTLDATISQPGIVPWIIVMAGFGIIVGVLGGRAIDVLTAASAAAVVCFAGVFIASGSDSPTADAVASGLLLGSIAGGFFRPWLRISIGSYWILSFLWRTIISHRTSAPGMMVSLSPVESADTNLAGNRNPETPPGIFQKAS